MITTAPARRAGLVVIALGALYAQYGGHPTVRHAFLGLAAAASGLVLATALKISAPLRTNPVGIGIAAVTLAAIAVVRLPLPIVLLVMAPLSIFVTTRAGR